MIKALVRFMMVTLLCSVSLFSFGYAQEECDVCGSTADAFQTYLDAMEQSIEVLNAIILAKSAVQDPITIDASQYAKIDQTFNDQMNEILIDVASPDGLGFAALKIQNASSVVQRDWGKLDLISQKLSSLFSIAFAKEVGSQEFTSDDVRKLNDALSQTMIVQFQSTEEGTPVVWNQGKRYNELIGSLRRINKFMKELYLTEFYHTTLVDVKSGTLQVYTKDPENAEKSVTSNQRGKIATQVAKLEKKIIIDGTSDDAGESIRRLEFTNDYQDLYLFIRTMQDAMACATGRRNECDEQYTSRIAQSAETARDTVKGDFKSAMNTFTTARQRLSGTMFPGASSADSNEAAKSRETELLQQYYGDSADAILAKEGIIRTVGRAITKKGYTFNDARKDLAEDTLADPVADYNETIGVLLAPTTTTETELVDRDANYDDEPSKKELIAQQKERFASLRESEYDDGLYTGGILGQQFEALEVSGIQQAYVDTVLLSQEFMDLERLLDTAPITKQFPQLSLNVFTNYELVGKKADEASITEAAVGICEIQCENLNPNCYQY